MLNLNPVKLFIPGVFLFVLGLGNLAVGITKAQQHQEVLTELQLQQPSALNLENSSSLKRLQLAEQTAHRTFQREQEAKDRMAFYKLVSFGGKIFTALGLILLICSGALHLLKSKEL